MCVITVYVPMSMLHVDALEEMGPSGSSFFLCVTVSGFVCMCGM